VPGSDLCQTHRTSSTSPKIVRPEDYEAQVVATRSPKGRPISTNIGHQRLIGRAKRKHDAMPLGGSTLSDMYGGHQSWWTKVVVYATDPKPKYLQKQNVAMLRAYLADKASDPRTEEPMGVMDPIGPAAEEEPSGPMHLAGHPNPQEGSIEYPKKEEPEPLSSLDAAREIIARSEDKGRTLAGWEESRREQLALVKDPEEEEPSLKELHDLWQKSREPQSKKDEKEFLAGTLAYDDLLERVTRLETMMAQVFHYLMETD